VSPSLRDVRQDPEDPGLERRALLEAVDSGEDADPCLLHDFLRHCGAGDIDLCDPEKRRVILPHEGCEHRFVTCPKRVDGLNIVHEDRRVHVYRL
jgi:hypothetical protein